MNISITLKCFKRRCAQELTFSNRRARVIQARQLLKFFLYRTSVSFFSQTKIIHSGCSVKHPEMKTCLIQCQRNRFRLSVWSAFSQSLTSKLGHMVTYVDPRAKANGQYYQDIMLTQHLLPAVRHISGNMITF